MMLQSQLIEELMKNGLGIKTGIMSPTIEPAGYAIKMHQVDGKKIPDKKWLSDRGWYVTEQEDCFGSRNKVKIGDVIYKIMLEPCNPNDCPKRSISSTLVHATDVVNEVSIRGRGIVTSGKSTTYTTRVYDPPRVHLATSYDCAIIFSKNVDVHQGERNWVYFEVTPTDEMVFYDDPLCPNGGVWTNSMIPADCIGNMYKLIRAHLVSEQTNDSALPSTPIP